MNIKAEEVSEVKVEEDPEPITFPKIKAEPEVSCMSTVRQISQICRNANCTSDLCLSVCADETIPACWLEFEERFLKCF
jgi:hypothetical protein